MTCSIATEVKALRTAYDALIRSCCGADPSLLAEVPTDNCVSIAKTIYANVAGMVDDPPSACKTLEESPDYPRPPPPAGPCWFNYRDLEQMKNWLENVNCSGSTPSVCPMNCDLNQTYVITFDGLVGKSAQFNGANTVTYVSGSNSFCTWNGVAQGGDFVQMILFFVDTTSTEANVQVRFVGYSTSDGFQKSMVLCDLPGVLIPDGTTQGTGVIS